MSGRSFLDTNVLIYTDDHDAPEKQRRAIEVYERVRRSRTGVISTQVLQEYFVAATRKLGVDAAVARRKVELFARLDVVQIDLGAILAAIDFQRLHRVSFWDALIVQAALAGGCATLLSEDMQHGRRIDGLEIVNPFL
jgi:predicted nucleic acid-binding protein